MIEPRNSTYPETTMDNRLENGDRFPSITAPVADGDELTIPDDLEGLWSVLIFYRGHW